jgi:hypothetical protein
VLFRSVIEKAALEPKRPLEEVIEEVVEAPSDLQFLSDDKQKILQGKKTQTSRTTIPDPKMKIGATVHAVIQEPRFADLRIVSIERKRLRYFNEDDAKNEGYDMLEEFKQKWQEVYEEWDESQLVYIIHFEKLK